MSVITDKYKTQPIVKLPLWDTRWPADALRARRNDIGIKAYNRGYRHEAITEGDLTFPHFWRMKKFGFGSDVIPGTWPCFGGIDISSDSRPGSVISTIAVNPENGKKYPKELRIGDWGSPRFVTEIHDCYNTHRHQIMLVENNGVQEMLQQWVLEKGYHVPIAGYLTGRQKWNPDVGLPSLDIEFENDSWFLPMEIVQGHITEECKCNWCRFIREFEGHPQYATTDVVMGTWFAREAVRLYWGRGYMIESSPMEEGVFEF